MVSWKVIKCKFHFTTLLIDRIIKHNNNNNNNNSLRNIQNDSVLSWFMTPLRPLSVARIGLPHYLYGSLPYRNTLCSVLEWINIFFTPGKKERMN